ncbi:MAG: FtsX-like permease family protein [Chloroflexota bacterium]
MDRLAWRALSSRPLRSFLTILGVGLGVGVLAASLTLSAALDTAVDRTVNDVVGRSDLRVSAFLENGLSAAAIEAVQGTAGVTESAAAIERRTFLGASPRGGTAAAVTVLGVDPPAYAKLHDLRIVAGSALARADEPAALVSERLAADDGYAVGSQITIQGVGAPEPLRIVGLLAGSGPLGGTGRTVVVPIQIAQRAFGLEGATRVDLRLDPGVPMGTVVAGIAQRLTTEPYILATPADLAATMRASSGDFQGMIALIAAIVLFVGAFVIVNTMSMTIGERAREVGLLRVAGATRWQVMRFVFVGALILGVVGSWLGVAVGAALALLMSGAVSSATGLAATVPPLDPVGAGIAGLVGVAITVLAAIEPAVRAARISPFETLRARFDVPAVRRARLGWLVVIFLAVGVLALVAWPPAISGAGSGRALAVYGVLLLFTLASPFILRPLGRLLGSPLALVFRLEERLARGSLARDRSRTALTLGSLVVGLAMIVALGWSAQAARRAASAWLVDVIPGDEVVSSIRPVAADEGVREALAAVPGVASVTPIATFDLAFRGLRVDAAAVVGADFLADGRLTARDGDLRAALHALDEGGSAILPAAEATRLGLRVGDTMSLPLGGFKHLDLQVAAIVARSIPAAGGEAILVGWPDALDPLGVRGADAFAVRFLPGRADAARPVLRETATTFALESNPIEAIQGAVADALARVFALFDALAIVAVVVAVLGIVNTLTMGVVERIREIGVLRAIGMSRRQAMRMVIVEAAVLGLVGIVLGSVAGLGVGAVLLALGGGLSPAVGFPWPPIALAAALGLVLPIVASFYPARMAARISIVSALHFE